MIPKTEKHLELKRLSLDSVKLAREKIQILGEEILADRARLIQDERETLKYKNETYFKFVKMMDGDELEIGLKGTLKIQSLK